MKTLLYMALMATCITGIFARNLNAYTESKNNLVIQAVDSNITLNQIIESAQIISGRLHDYCDGKIEVNHVPEKNQIQVLYPSDCNQQYIENLLVNKGSLAFYETYNRKELVESPDNNYTDYSGNTLLTGSNIENVSYNHDKMSNSYYIRIRFNKSSEALWQAVTENNLNRAIAIVLDGTVISAPIVKSVIKGGNCEISGNFTEAEARYITAMIGNGELPVNFKIVQQ